MPRRRLDMFRHWLPILRAREELRAITVVMAGSGTFEADARRAYVSGLEVAANEGTTPRAPAIRATSGEHAMAMMAEMGATVVGAAP